MAGRPRLRRRRAGQGLVELAMALPILLLLVLGVVEFARAWNIHQVLTDAGREGARTAVVFDPTITEDSVRAVVRAAIGRSGVDPNTAQVYVEGNFKGSRGLPTTVRIEMPYRLRIIQGFMNWATPDATFTLRASSTFRNE